MSSKSASLIEEEFEPYPSQPESTHVLVCPRYPVAKLMGLLPAKYIESMEQNQLLVTCCRHPENHEIEAFKSKPEEPAPDIYIMHCVCGRKHIRFCIGGGDVRPFWEVV